MTTHRSGVADPAQANPAAPHDISIRLVQFLIVDDHAFVRGIVSEHLRSCGIYRFGYAHDGADAIRLLKDLSLKPGDTPLVDLGGLGPDATGAVFPESADAKALHAYCIITDFGMPNANGLQLLQAVRCGETHVPRDTPVILLTGYADEYVVATALRLDVNAFILKPVSRNSLWEKLQRVLNAEAPVMDVAAYAAVDIPDEGGETIVPAPGPAIVLVAPKEEADTSILWVSLGAVQPGAVLALDLFGEHGTLLLKKGTVFSERLLHKLEDVQRMTGLSGTIPIKRPPAEPVPAVPAP